MKRTFVIIEVLVRILTMVLSKQLLYIESVI